MVETRKLDELARKVAAGDTGAYTLLLREASKFIRAYVYVRVNSQDRAAVEDIAQDTLLAVHTKYHSYDPSLPFLPWLRTVAHHKLVDHWRRQKISHFISIDDEEAQELPSGVTPIDTEVSTALTLEKLFEKLSDKQRRIVQLARLDGKSMNEIASELSISVSDAKVTLHRAIVKLSVLAKGESHAHG